MSVNDGQAVSAAITNAAFVSKTATSSNTVTGKVDLNNTSDAASGNQVTNIQRELNKLNSFLGSTLNTAKDTKPTWTNNDVGASTDDTKTRADNLTERFNESTGHTHDGTPGSGGPLPEASLVVSGIVNTSQQSFAGIKQFAALSIFEKGLSWDADTEGGGGTIAELTNTTGIIIITGSGATTIQSMSQFLGPEAGPEGKLVLIHNDTDAVVTVVHEEGTATAAKRFFLPGAENLEIEVSQSVLFFYDVFDLRWKQVGGTGSGSEFSKETITLDGTDISNGYVDLAAEASLNSVVLSHNRQLLAEGASYDYTTSVVSSVTRITFANDFASSGSAAFVSGDIIHVQYQLA